MLKPINIHIACRFLIVQFSNLCMQFDALPQNRHGLSGKKYIDIDLLYLQDTPILLPLTSDPRAEEDDGVGEERVESSTESWHLKETLL